MCLLSASRNKTHFVVVIIVIISSFAELIITREQQENNTIGGGLWTKAKDAQSSCATSKSKTQRRIQEGAIDQWSISHNPQQQSNVQKQPHTVSLFGSVNM